MSRLFLVLLVAGAFVIAPAASADVPDCDCTEFPACVLSCPGAGTDNGHGAGQDIDWVVTLYTEDCLGPMVGFDCYRIALADVSPDSMCVCDEECADFSYIYPEGPTNGFGQGTFRFRGTILNLETDTSPGAEVPRLEVCGCGDIPVLVRSPDIVPNCNVELADFVVFSSSFGLAPCLAQPTGLQHYTVYTVHCAPCNRPQLSDFVVFSRHFGHNCTPGACDP